MKKKLSIFLAISLIIATMTPLTAHSESEDDANVDTAIESTADSTAVDTSGDTIDSGDTDSGDITDPTDPTNPDPTDPTNPDPTNPDPSDPSEEDVTEYVYDVTEYGAMGDDDLGDSKVINTLLKTAATSTKPVKLVFPAGVYIIDSPLYMYSNTTISLDADAVMFATSMDNSMVYGCHADENGKRCVGANCTHGGYSQTQNILVEGGTWDRNPELIAGINQFFEIRHGNNLVFRNITFKNGTEHYLNVAGSHDVHIENVTMTDQLLSTTTNPHYWTAGTKPGDVERALTMEVIHTDYTAEDSESSDLCYPLDGTTCSDIYVTDCTFENIFSGIGNHHVNPNGLTSGIYVNNCTFTDVKFIALWAVSMEDIVFTNNKITNCEAIAKCMFVDRLNISDNSIKVSEDAQRHTLYITDGTTGILSGNKILNASNTVAGSLVNIRVTGSYVDIVNNTCLNSSFHGIYIDDNSIINSLSGNIIDGSHGSGLRVDNSEVVATNNEIKNITEHGALITNNSKIIFNNNIVDLTGSCAISAKSSKVQVVGNTFTNIGLHGVSMIDCIADASENHVKDNTISDCTGSAISITNSDQYMIDGNIINGTGTHGVNLKGSGSLIFNNNTVKGTLGHGLYASALVDSPLKLSISDNTIITAGSSSFDIRIGDYVDFALNHNTLGTRGLSYTALATTTLDTPVLISAANDKAGLLVSWNAVDYAKKYRVYRKVSGGKWTSIGETSATSFVDKTAESGKTYTYTVCCLVTDSTTNVSTEISSYNTTGVSATYLGSINPSIANSQTGITIKWTAVPGATGYVVRRKAENGAYSTIKNITNASTVSYEDTAVKSGTTYTYYVYATNGGSKGFYTEKSIMALTYQVPALSNASTGITVKWTKVIGATGYTIYRKTGDGSYSTLKTITSGSTVSYTDTTAKSGTKYTYAVQATSSSYKSVYTGKSLIFLAAPTTSVSNTATGVTVKWNKITGATDYVIYRKTGTGSYATLKTVSGGSTVSYIDTSAKSGTKYTYLVKAKNGGALSTGSGKSTIFLSSLTPTLSNTTTGVKVSWTKVTGASGYVVYRKSGTGSYSAIKTITSGSTVAYTDTSAKSGTKYTYAVRATKDSYKGAFTGASKLFLKSITPTLSKTTSGVKVSWTKVTGASGYYVYRKSGTGSYTKIATIKSGSTISYVDKAVKDKKGTYTYAVKAYNSSTVAAYTGKSITLK